MNLLQLTLSGGGAFREVSAIVGGLSFRTATRSLPGTPHTIYDVLWHTERSQQLLLSHASGADVDWGAVGSLWPPTVSEEEWARVLRDFEVGLAHAQMLAEDPSERARDALTDLAAHNAYHLGQVVLLRQLLGDWNPPVTLGGEVA
ncbi:hypothetical protein [Deinococcus pimensis]|uniref:hypothetical protein n=1 Tax=Deinococcus pimensis TaxID=309888 RepID=UPI00048916DA|nr:hypothetical protein [Deinococcus pimensis]